MRRKIISKIIYGLILAGLLSLLIGSLSGRLGNIKSEQQMGEETFYDYNSWDSAGDWNDDTFHWAIPSDDSK